MNLDEMTELSSLEGTVSTLVYQNKENGYTVLRLKIESGESVNVVGVLPLMSVGERIIATGSWTRHPQHGDQFQAQWVEHKMPAGADAIYAYLSSRVIKGIGARTARKIVDLFGDKSLDIIENEFERLTVIPGITYEKAREINKSMIKQVGIRRLMEFLLAHNLPAQLAMRLYKAYGELSMQIVCDNPYVLAGSYFDVDFSVVDAFALELGIDGQSEQRLEAGTIFELTHNLSNGHSFLPLEKLIQATATLLNAESGLIREAAQSLAERNEIIIDRVAGIEACYLSEYYEAETCVADRINHMAERSFDLPPDMDEIIDAIENQQGITYATMQREAIKKAAKCQIMILTGGPGTGKTTTVQGILAVFEALELKTVIAAPTGRAAKRMSELCGKEASTIHRLLDVQFREETGDMVFTHDESEPIKADAVIVDETSMVDLQLMYALLSALSKECRLILVGDPDQLPSVGAGNLFSDMIRSKNVAMVSLTEIFRQAQESLIVTNAHRVNRGELPELSIKDMDFFFLKRRNSTGVIETIIELCKTRLPEHMGIAPDQIQVLSPTRRHETGTNSLNRHLQEALNPPAPGKREKKFGEFIFREGDRVMQIRNNYDIIWKKANGPEVGTGVFNGDIGQILSIDLAIETIDIQFEDKIAEYSFSMLQELEPAYAMTIHKAQGSEYRAVIMAALDGSQYLLTRSVLYTAMTRARELFIAVGDEQIIAHMTKNDKQRRRYSGLRARLADDGS